jgi:hypothetical protein
VKSQIKQVVNGNIDLAKIIVGVEVEKRLWGPLILWVFYSPHLFFMHIAI